VRVERCDEIGAVGGVAKKIAQRHLEHCVLNLVAHFMALLDRVFCLHPEALRFFDQVSGTFDHVGTAPFTHSARLTGYGQRLCTPLYR
jgi:hypothetical protein